MKLSRSLMLFCMTSSLVGVALADNTYKSTTVFKSDFQTQDWNGSKITIGTLKGINKTFDSKVSSFPNGESVQNCLIRAVRKGDSFESISNCSITDKDGDMSYTLSERKQGDISAGGKGKTKMLGGTGKYKGLTSTCEYTAKYLPENWVVVESECVKD